MTRLITQTIEILKMFWHAQGNCLSLLFCLSRPNLSSVENDIVEHFYDISGHDDLVTVCQELGHGCTILKNYKFSVSGKVVLVLDNFCSNVLSKHSRCHRVCSCWVHTHMAHVKYAKQRQHCRSDGTA